MLRQLDERFRRVCLVDLQPANYLWSYLHCCNRFRILLETEDVHEKVNLALPMEKMVQHQLRYDPQEDLGLEGVIMPHRWSEPQFVGDWDRCVNRNHEAPYPYWEVLQ